MKRRIAFRRPDYELLRSHVLQGPEEEAAVCLGGHVVTDEVLALLIREVHPVPEEFLVSHDGTFVEIDPVWLAANIKKARATRLSIVIVHSHPFSSDGVRFSSIDTSGQERLLPKLQARVPDVPHAEMVFGQESIDSLIWPSRATRPEAVDEVRVIDEAVEMLPTTRDAKARVNLSSEDDRQVRFLGEEGQRRLRSLKVGVVGAGGNGGPILMELTHLGVGNIVAVDPDLIEASNRNRIPDAQEEDDGKVAKVDVAKRYASRVRPRTTVLPIDETIEDSWHALRDCDVIFGCTDDLSSRFALNRLASQYFIPLIDMGVEIEVVEGQVRTIAGRVNVIRPGGKCLEALGFTSEEAARRELSNRRRSGYVQDDPAASAMPANLLVAGVAGIEFLKLFHGLLGGSPTDRYFAYSGRSGELRACAATGGVCEACEEFEGLGDVRSLPLVNPEAQRQPA